MLFTHHFRVLTCALFLLASVNVYAQIWQYAATSDAEVNYYIDPISIKEVGGLREFTQLSNHPTGYLYEGKKVFSIKTFRTANCESNSYKSNYLMGYSKINGEGDIVLVDKNPRGEWVTVTPDSISSKMQYVVCAKD